MLLPLTILTRTSASEPPAEKLVGVNPAAIGQVEEGVDEGTVQVWCEGQGKPFVVRGTVEEIIGAVNGLLSGGE